MNTNFTNNFKSYQLEDVSILNMNILTFCFSRKVSGNENLFLCNMVFIALKSAEIKLFVEDCFFY